MTNTSGTLCIGMTGNLECRILEHRHGVVDGCTSKYRITKLALAEPFSDARDAEKQLKNWSRQTKITLVDASNPGGEISLMDWVNVLPPRNCALAQAEISRLRATRHVKVGAGIDRVVSKLGSVLSAIWGTHNAVNP